LGGLPAARSVDQPAVLFLEKQRVTENPSTVNGALKLENKSNLVPPTCVVDDHCD
jgi:hypothetical protein